MAAVFPRSSAAWLFPNLELLKYLGLAAMLVDHLNIYVLDNAYPQAEYFGSLAFPLFGFALAAGVSRCDLDGARKVLIRLTVWACVAQVAALSVRSALPLNVLFTFALGLGAHIAYRLSNQALLPVFAALGLGLFCEYWAFGVLFVFLALEAARERTPLLWLFPVGVLFTFAPFNSGNFFALLSLPVGLLAAFLPADLPRVRGLFYWVYAGQFPALYLGARAIGAGS